METVKVKYQLSKDAVLAELKKTGVNLPFDQVESIDFRQLSEDDRNLLLSVGEFHQNGLTIKFPVDGVGVDNLISSVNKRINMAIEQNKKVYKEIIEGKNGFLEYWVLSDLRCHVIKNRSELPTIIKNISWSLSDSENKELQVYLENILETQRNEENRKRIEKEEKEALQKKQEEARIAKNNERNERNKQWGLENGSELLKARIRNGFYYKDLLEEEWIAANIPSGWSLGKQYSGLLNYTTPNLDEIQEFEYWKNNSNIENVRIVSAEIEDDDTTVFHLLQAEFKNFPFDNRTFIYLEIGQEDVEVDSEEEYAYED